MRVPHPERDIDYSWPHPNTGGVVVIAFRAWRGYLSNTLLYLASAPTWSFATVSLRGIEASDDRAVASAINVPSLVHGAVAYGGIRNSETVSLQFAAGEASRYKALSVIIPIAVWRQIAGSADPGSFKDKVVEVQTTPQVAGGKYINIRISAATQLHVVAAR
jgi:hypothetical protein